jgi:hypothetical protein
MLVYLDRCLPQFAGRSPHDMREERIPIDRGGAGKISRPFVLEADQARSRILLLMMTDEARLLCGSEVYGCHILLGSSLEIPTCVVP